MKRLLLGLILVALALPSFAQNVQNTFRLMPESGGAFSSHLRLMPSYVDARVLAATTNESVTVPTGAKYVVFSSNCAAFYVENGGTAAIPAADVTDGTGSELNPSGYFIDGVSSFGIISPTTCIVTMAFYK